MSISMWLLSIIQIKNDKRTERFHPLQNAHLQFASVSLFKPKYTHTLYDRNNESK